jgi:integrase
VYVPLPSFVVEALEACPRISERYWFWTGVGSKETLAGNWRRTFSRLCKIAGVQAGHPHRFRDTLAVELLLEGVPIERVSILLGHSSVKITERHHAPWGGRVRRNSKRTWCALGGTIPSLRRRCFALKWPPRVDRACKWQRHIRDTQRTRPLTSA